MSPALRDYVLATRQIQNGYRMEGEIGAYHQRQEDIGPFLDRSLPLKVLDLGNGRLRPQYLLLRAAGHEVVGIDLINQDPSIFKKYAYRFARWLYAKHLIGNGGSTKNDRLICGDVATLPIRSEYFDLISSVAAFEHFLKVPKVVSELERVLKPGGLAWVLIHPFTCLSGAHNISFSEFPIKTLPKGVEAWDHLRRRRLAFSVPLNELRIGQYLDTFGRHFEILKHYCYVREGEHLLTPEIQAELSGYSRHELTCLAYVIVARKAQ